MSSKPAAQRGYHDRISALADHLEQAIIAADVGVKAQLAAQYRAVLAELKAADPTTAQKADDPIDQFASARNKRRQPAA
jgi:hypothetical protein